MTYANFLGFLIPPSPRPLTKFLILFVLKIWVFGGLGWSLLKAVIGYASGIIPIYISSEKFLPQSRFRDTVLGVARIWRRGLPLRNFRYHPTSKR